MHGLKTELPSAASNPCTQRPNSNFRPFGTALFCASRGVLRLSFDSPWTRDKKARIRCLDRLTEWSIWNPSGSDRRDPNTLAPNGRKLGRLQRARQGLVRVPESNTKYGGKGGKTGVARRLPFGQVSVSPQGFPSKKSLFRAPGHASPRCSQGNYFLSTYCPPGLAPPRLTGLNVKLPACPGWHARRPMVSAADKRHVGLGSIRKFIP